MKTQHRHRSRRSGLLPTMLLAAATVAIASVGHAEELPRTALNAQFVAAPTVSGASLREEMQAMANEAAWRTRVSIAQELSARLNRQHRPYRIASLEAAMPRG